MLEALLKRVDGLEARLKDQKKSETSPIAEDSSSLAADTTPNAESVETAPAVTVTEPERPCSTVDTSRAVEAAGESAVYSPSAESEKSPEVHPDALLDTYFSRFHAKPFHIVDESTVRQRLQLNQLPSYLIHAIYAVAAR